jgi:hypothetical protein
MIILIPVSGDMQKTLARCFPVECAWGPIHREARVFTQDSDAVRGSPVSLIGGGSHRDYFNQTRFSSALVTTSGLGSRSVGPT